MDSSYEEETAPLISRFGIPRTVPDTRQPHEKQLAVNFILTSILLERIAFYALAANIAFNIETEKVSSISANGSIVSFIFSGVSYISTIIFAILSDGLFGRFKTIIFGFVLYLIGYASAILITMPNISNCTNTVYNDTITLKMNSINQNWCRFWIQATFFIIATGSGAVQANMIVFGAEQLQESKTKSRYFDKYVIVLNISAIFAVWVLRFLYKDNKDYRVPCTVAASMLFMAALLFVMGWKYYVHVKPYETVVVKCIPVIINAFQSWYKYKQNKQSNFTPPNLVNSSEDLTEVEESVSIDEPPSTFLDFAKAVNNGKFHDRIVDDVKSLRGAFVVFIFLIPYWLIYNQLNSIFAVQGKYMQDSNKINMVGTMWLGDSVTIIIGILILNMFVYKCLNAWNRSLTVVTKFVIGMSCAVITMCLAGIVEAVRQNNCNKNYEYNQSSLKIYYQLPQYIFMGLSEMFAMVASFEFAYFAAPRSAQTLFMSLRSCSVGIASFLATAYLAVFSKTSSKMDFSCPRKGNSQWTFYTYFYILGGLQLIFVVIFIVCQRKFQIIKMNPQQMEINQFLQHSSVSSSGRHSTYSFFL